MTYELFSFRCNTEATCSEWVLTGLQGSHIVDVDPDGEEGIEEPFRVYCDTETNPNGTTTIGTLYVKSLSMLAIYKRVYGHYGERCDWPTDFAVGQSQLSSP